MSIKMNSPEEHPAEGALDALRPAAVVPTGDELAAAAPGALVKDLKRGKTVGTIVYFF